MGAGALFKNDIVYSGGIVWSNSLLFVVEMATMGKQTSHATVCFSCPVDSGYRFKQFCWQY
jgi:hypothetical protein